MVKTIIDNKHPIYELRQIYNRVRILNEEVIHDTISQGFSSLEHEIAFSNLAFELLNADLEISRRKDLVLQRINEDERAGWNFSIDGYLSNIKKWNKEAVVYLSFYSNTIDFEEFLKRKQE